MTGQFLRHSAANGAEIAHSGAASTTRWAVVVPAKDPAAGKSRLGAADDGALAAAMLADALAAVVASDAVRELVVVTGSSRVVALVTSLDSAAAATGTILRVVADPGTGLNPAIEAGLAAAAAPVAVLLGDLPALVGTDLTGALAAADAVPFGVIPDADGTGTTLITGRDERPVPRFGTGSAARHLAAGHARLDVPAASGLRRDVDTRADLDAAVAIGVGPATAAVLAGYVDSIIT